MPNVFFDIRRVTKNRVGMKSMRRRLTLNRDERWEGQGESREIAWKWKETLRVIQNYIQEEVRGKGKIVQGGEMNYSSGVRERRGEGRGGERG